MIYSAGRPRGLFMGITGAWIPAVQAEQWGLIYKCTAPEQLDAEVDAVARMIEELPPLAVAAGLSVLPLLIPIVVLLMYRLKAVEVQL